MYVSDYIDIFYKPIYYLLISYNIECDQNDCDVKLTAFYQLFKLYCLYH